MRKSKGMMLLEVELALFLVIVTVGIFLSACILGGYYLKRAQGNTTAVFLAQMELNEAIASSGDSSFSLQGNFPSPYDRYRYNVAITPMSGDLSGDFSTVLVTVESPREMEGGTAQSVGIVENSEVGWK